MRSPGFKLQNHLRWIVSGLVFLVIVALIICAVNAILFISDLGRVSYATWNYKNKAKKVVILQGMPVLAQDNTWSVYAEHNAKRFWLFGPPSSDAPSSLGNVYWSKDEKLTIVTTSDSKSSPVVVFDYLYDQSIREKSKILTAIKNHGGFGKQIHPPDSVQPNIKDISES